MRIWTTFFTAAVTAGALAMAPAGAAAQEPRTGPVLKIVVPFTPGSATDTIVRVYADRLGAELGRTVVVDYRPGAGGTIGASAVARSDADGSTLLAHSSAFTAAPALFSKLPYDTTGDLAGATILAALPSVLVVGAASPFRSVADLVAAAKASPGKLTYGTGGIGSGMHMHSEKTNIALGIRGIHVPFKGSAEVMTELAAGRLDFAVISLTSAQTFMRDGRVRALANPASARSTLAPEIPSLAELGFPGADYRAWVGLLAPARMPKPALDRLRNAVAAIAAKEDIRSRLAQMGAEPDPLPPAAFDRQIATEVKLNIDLAKAAGIQPQ